MNIVLLNMILNVCTSKLGVRSCSLHLRPPAAFEGPLPLKACVTFIRSRSGCS